MASAETFTINTDIGAFPVDVPHLALSGALVKSPSVPAPEFRPPSVFSAPLPSGSGARALGLAGAFTAVADDATAASWNPGGLLQLESPELSVAFRASRNRHRHRTDEDDLQVVEDDFRSSGLNYLSAVYPFQLWSRNFVVSLNLQEAYDFTRVFHANWSQSEQSHAQARKTEEFHAEQTDRIYAGNGLSHIDITKVTDTIHSTVLSQVLDSSLLTDLDFEQEGVIYATTPALAVEVTPRLSFGLAVNFYQDDPFGGAGVRSSTRALYRGGSLGQTHITDTLTTSGTISWTGESISPPDAETTRWSTNPITPGSVVIPSFSDRTSATEQSGTRVQGLYEEENALHGFEGMNLTLGGFWTVSRLLTLGASVDLPWTAEASQTKSIHNRSRTYDLHGRLLDEVDETDRYVKTVEFDFPLRAALGAALRWSDAFTTSMDVEYTRWSDFAFQAAGGSRINPLDGTPYGENELEDCWAVRCGAEYLLILERTEIPFRVGVGREERPAIGRPDELWQYSVGTGFAIGQGAHRYVVDIAYLCTVGSDVMGSLVPGRDVTTDVVEQDVYVSCIRHF